ncbi:DUF2235 domain-containing protein [Bradyrhizobium sp. CCBAU 53421]|uniref:DUF2235 domain-containing protein n=1 Tax=Bradyrhizobium sp. CCBAU 53421 TaxID=1325120 RepID=UPI00188D6554|nr:DUF2235 domain-containing protein [Bradyrhizobium sp. CCBAU 53421]QOZ33260.1 DUF2235 domain-containing protein [Bradyrhizobium sp. CCBAU 53421]
MAKNIVVYSDGTGQDGGVRPEQRVSNVYKMYRASRTGPENPIDPHEQVAFYDPGLGTDIGATALSAPWRFVQKLLGSVIGNGIVKNIADCYAFIINHYEPGDRVFLIGFSRGAYTVRSLANLLMLCGVPTKTPTGPLTRFRKQVDDIAIEAVTVVLEHGAGYPRAQYAAEREEQARRFREKYGSDGDFNSNVAPYFIGVFDTVASLGAKGLRRFIIQAGLALAFALTVAVVAAFPALLVAWFVDRWLPFWPSWWGLLALTVVGLGGYWMHRQKQSRLKVIRDFPNPGDPPREHYAEWKDENFDRLLSVYVRFGRAANAIDENRKDFQRVPWGTVADDPAAKPNAEGPPKLVQMWFAGNHSDIGGSYPEAESRLSDNALAWMIEEATSIPDGLTLGPVFVNGIKLENTGGAGTPLNLYPHHDGVQHCELAGMRDTIDGYMEKLPGWMKWLRGWLSRLNWEEEFRKIPYDARVHPSVRQRFKLDEVTQCAGRGPYRPESMRHHDEFKIYYPPS